MTKTTRTCAPEAAASTLPPVKAYVEYLKAELGKTNVAIRIPAGTAAYRLGFRFATCAADELPDYLAGGATLA